jgi:hypothetical protein
MKLAFSWNGEGYEWLRLHIKFHFPESGSEVQGGENSGISLTDISNAFGYLLHGVYVNVEILVEFSEVLYNSESVTLLLRDKTYWVVV